MDCDAIVIGSGAGGGTLAGELASCGSRILLIERGRRIEDRALFQDERAMFEQRIASDERISAINGRASRPLIGSLPGGSTALFGAAMLRPAPEDFEPARAYRDRIPASLARWPIEYADLEPHLERAEDLYGVAGDHLQTTPALGRRRLPYKAALPAVDPINRRLMAGFEALGLRPFQLPLAIDFDRCKRCPGCPGMLCPHDARASSFNRAIRPRIGAGLTFWEGVEAERLEHDGRSIGAVWLRLRDSGRRMRVTAPIVAVSAGAIGTPALLLRSEIPDASGQLGRNHMCHLGTLAAAAFRKPTGAQDRFVKQLGLSDHYLGTPELPEKLGLVQQIPIPGPRSIARELGLPIPSRLTQALRSRLLLFAGTLEDLPDPANRVSLERSGQPRLVRRFGAYDLSRARRWARILSRDVRRAGADLAFRHVAARAHDHLAHQVGTCRFGRDARQSVLDPFCRVHALDNLFVVDGSFMPTSLGVGPALTIAANALRVAEHLIGRRSNS